MGLQELQRLSDDVCQGLRREEQSKCLISTQFVNAQVKDAHSRAKATQQDEQPDRASCPWHLCVYRSIEAYANSRNVT